MAASDNVSRNQFHMHLYHGTSTAALDPITRSGLGGQRSAQSGVYLTNDENLARYYADAAADQEGGDPVVVTARANPRHLTVDTNAFADPVYAREYGAQKRSFDPDKLRDMEKDWKNSLREAGSVYHEGPIPPEDILGVEYPGR